MESVKVERLPRGAGISMQDNDDLAKTLRAFPMVITWHDGDVHGNRGTTTWHLNDSPCARTCTVERDETRRSSGQAPVSVLPPADGMFEKPALTPHA
jgi:hypothetical protein